MAKRLSFFVVAFLLLVGACCAYTECRDRDDCRRVSDRPDFVSCVNRSCACAVERGYVGDATASSKCSCPYESIMVRGAFYCIQPQSAVVLQQQNETVAANIATVEGWFAALIWYNDTYNPLRFIYAAIGLPSNYSIYEYFSPDAAIYVEPFGGFGDPVSAALYYLIPSIWQIQVPTIYFHHVFGQYNQVHLRADLGFGFDGQVFVNVTEAAAYTMTDDHRIVSADAVAYYVGKASNPPDSLHQAYMEGFCADMTANPGFYATSTQQHGFCSAQYDPLGFYANFSECMAFVQSIPFGTYDDGEEDSFICRLIHTQMAFFDPSVHCKHTGKTGGGFCTPHSYASFYDKVYKKRGVAQPDISAGIFGPGLSAAVARSPPNAAAFAAASAAQLAYVAPRSTAMHR